MTCAYPVIQPLEDDQTSRSRLRRAARGFTQFRLVECASQGATSAHTSR
jgi:hypothetical protein